MGEPIFNISRLYHIVCRCNTNLLRCLRRCCRAAVLPHDSAAARRVPCRCRPASSGSPSSFADFTASRASTVVEFGVIKLLCRTDGLTHTHTQLYSPSKAATIKKQTKQRKRSEIKHCKISQTQQDNTIQY